MKHVVSAVAAAVLTTGLLVATPGQSIAVAGDLPIKHLTDIVVAQSAGKVFISGDGSVTVADLTGAVLGAVPGVTGAGRLALTPDGAKVVTLTAGGFTVIDAVASTVDKTISPGTNVCPKTIAPASGKIFFSYLPCDGQGNGNLGAVDLATGTVSTALLGTGSSYYGDAELAGTSSASSVLAAAWFDDIYVIDTTGGATPTASIRTEQFWGDDPVIALNPDGTELYTSDYSGHIQGRDPDSFDVVHTYAADGPQIAVRNDGYLALGLYGEEAEVAFFRVGVGTAERAVDFGYTTSGATQTQEVLLSRGVAFGATKLYVVTAPAARGYLRLRVVTPGPATKLAVTTDKSYYNPGSTATVSVDLQSATTDRTVSLWSSVNGSARKLLKTGTVNASSHKLTVRVPDMMRNTRFYGTFAGDDSHPAAEAKRDVKVRAVVKLSSASTSASGIYHRLKASSSPTISGVVTPYNPLQPVRCSAAVYSGGAWRTVDTTTVRTTSASKFGVKLVGFKAGQKIRVSATYIGTRNGQSTKVSYYVVLS